MALHLTTKIEIEAAPEALPAKVSGRLRAGDSLRIETPGGGGHGLTD